MSRRVALALWLAGTLFMLPGCDVSPADTTATPILPSPTVALGTPRPGCDCLIEATALTDPPAAAPGDTVAITVVLSNRGACAYAEAIVAAPVLTGTAYIPDTVTGGATYDPAARAIRWQDRFLTPAHPLGYQVRIEPDAAAGPLPVPIAIDPRCQYQAPYIVTATLQIAAPAH